MQDSPHPPGVTCDTAELCLHAFDSAREEKWTDLYVMVSQEAFFIHCRQKTELAIDY